VSATRLHIDRVDAVGVGDMSLYGQSVDNSVVAVVRDGDGLILGCPKNRNDVRRQVGSPVEGSEIHVDLVHTGTSQVTYGDMVGTGERCNVQDLHAVQLHGDCANVPGQQDVAAVSGNVDFFSRVGAVELQSIRAAASVHGIAVVAGTPDKGVVAGTE